MEVRKTIINNTHGMSLVNFVNERVSFNACVCIELISLVNGLPLQCRMTFLTPSHTHTHTLSQGFYDAIKTEPFQYHEGGDELTEVFFNPDHQGWLIKEGTCRICQTLEYYL